MILESLISIVPILGILVTTLVSIIAIRNTAKANRISNIHNEMLYCIIDSMVIIEKSRLLLEAMSRGTSYYSIPDNKFIETAHNRYWREVKSISEEFRFIQSKQKFVLPKKLYDDMQKLINKINEAREEAKTLSVNEENIYSDTSGMKAIVKEIDLIYVDFIHSSRNYLGVDELELISRKNDQILKINETTKSYNNHLHPTQKDARVK